MNFIYYDLAAKTTSKTLDLFFPGFEPPAESIVILSPHDDDAFLGAGYLIQAAREAGAAIKIIIICDGRAGYSRIEDKAGIVERRKEETLAAYQELGLKPADLFRLDLPDFSALHYLGWQLPNGKTGLFAQLVPLLRRLRVTRLLIPNGHREHIDHTAVYLAGIFFGPQVGDAVIADWGSAPPLKTSLVYSVWADFPAPADRAILAPLAAEEKVMAALQKFASQARVIQSLVAARAGRRQANQVLELYQTLDPRPPLDFSPIWEQIIGLS